MGGMNGVAWAAVLRCPCSLHLVFVGFTPRTASRTEPSPPQSNRRAQAKARALKTAEINSFPIVGSASRLGDPDTFLSFRELEPPPRAALAILLTFLHARVPRQKSRIAKRH